MTDKAIRLIIERLNGENHNDVILAPISNNVWWGFVWGETEQGYEPEGFIQERGLEFFFIRAKDKKFAAAVFRMGRDEMHWFVAEKYRRLHILAQPLKKTIPPFIFNCHREAFQAASVDIGPYSKYSAKLARRIGFKCVSSNNGKENFVIKSKDVPVFIPTLRPRLN